MRIDDVFTYLLYKIDEVLSWSNGGHGFEMAVEVALVEKAAFKSGFSNIPALS